MKFPIIELIDRLSIAEVKQNMTNDNDVELEFYRQQCVDLDLDKIGDLYAQLVQVHTKIWQLEAKLREGRDDELGLEEIGRRAIKIRDWNNKRINIRNRIADIIDTDDVREIKVDHCSADTKPRPMWTTSRKYIKMKKDIWGFVITFTTLIAVTLILDFYLNH